MDSIFSLPLEFQVSYWAWALAFFSAFLLGISKAGLKGISIIIVTSLALAFGTKASTGIILPLLIIGDIFAVVYYRKHTQWTYLKKLLPWMMLGVVIGTWVGKDLPEEVFKKGMALIIFVSVIIMYWWDKRSSPIVPNQWWFAGTMGLLAGFTTMIGNLAGAFSNIFFLAMRLPKNEFIGTAAWLFFLINLFKLPFHIFSWETVNVHSLKVSFRLVILEVIGLWIGFKIIQMIKDKQYRSMILILTALGALLIWLRN